jgi:hypothetical protein
VADDAGALLVRSGLVSAKALDSARAAATRAGGTLGEHLVAAGAISDDALTEFYRSRLLVPQVNPNSLARLKTKVVEAIPPDMAVELRAVPVAFDADGNLMVAMSDPSDRHAVDEIAFFTGNYVVRAVATQMQIAWCLAHYYGHVTELGQRLLVPREDDPGPAPAPSPAASDPGIQVRPAEHQPGDTARVEASRHRVVPPVDTVTSEVRPSPRLLDRPAATAVEPKSAGGRSRTISGEIVPGAARSKTPPNSVPQEIEAELSEPEITITAEEPTSPGVRARRPRTDPPELAARGGEVLARAANDARITREEHSIVVDLAALEPQRAIEASGEIALPRNGPSAAKSAAAPAPIDDEPSIRVELGPELDEAAADADESPAMIHAAKAPAEAEGDGAPRADAAPTDPIPVEVVASDEPSVPILLDRPRARATPPPAMPAPATPAAHEPTEVGDDTEVIMLDAPRRPRTTSERRAQRRTQLGLGRVGYPRMARDTEVVELPPGADGTASPDLLIAPEPATTTEAPADKTVVTNAAPDDGVAVDAIAAPPEPVKPAAAPPEPPTPEPPASTPSPTATPTALARLALVKRPVVTPPAAATARIPKPIVPREPARPEPTPALAVRSPTSDDTVIEAVEDDDTKRHELNIPIPDPTGRYHGVPAPPSDDDRPTGTFDAVAPPPEPEPAEAPASATPKRRIDHDDVDDGWGPPGTTIPPPLLGSATVDDSAPVGKIPIDDDDEAEAPLLLAAAEAPRAVAPTATAADASLMARDLETAATRLVVILRDIDQSTSRDEVIYSLISHLAETHNRAAFFSVKNGELNVFSVRAPDVAEPRAALNLDHASTFQDVVGTRLPYRGPVVDDPSRTFLQRLLGNAPSEMLLIPLAVRDRVVGVLYADGRRRQTFDDHYAIAARAGGIALERILKQRPKTQT